jgi:hypothetical protein
MSVTNGISGPVAIFFGLRVTAGRNLQQQSHADAAPIVDPSRMPVRAPAILIDDADGRSKHFRRFKALIEAFGDQIGGRDGLSPAQATTLRNAAALQLHIETLQGRLVCGVAVDGGELARLTTTVARLLAQLHRGRQAGPIAA